MIPDGADYFFDFDGVVFLDCAYQGPIPRVTAEEIQRVLPLKTHPNRITKDVYFSFPDRARSAVFSSIPDAVLVSGQITGEAAALSDLEAVKAVLPDTPVMANTGVKHETVADVLRIADGCVVGSSLKVDGNTWNPVDPDRASDFMARARAAR